MAHIEPERLLVYRLLAGDVAHVTQHVELDWRRAFALNLWSVLAAPEAFDTRSLKQGHTPLSSGLCCSSCVGWVCVE